MKATDIAKDFIRIANTAGLGKDVIDLMEKKLALLTQEVADLTSKNAVLVARVSQLETDKANLESQMQKLRPEGGALDQQSKQILKFFFDRPDGLTSDEIAQRFRLSKSAADYHVDVLFKRKFLQQLSVGMSPRCCINHNGREFVMTNAVQPVACQTLTRGAAPILGDANRKGGWKARTTKPARIRPFGKQPDRHVPNNAVTLAASSRGHC